MSSTTRCGEPMVSARDKLPIERSHAGEAVFLPQEFRLECHPSTLEIDLQRSVERELKGASLPQGPGGYHLIQDSCAGNPLASR